MNALQQTAIRQPVAEAPRCAVPVHHRGRAFHPRWSQYPDGRLCLALDDVQGIMPPLAASADVAWICHEDQIVLRDAELHRALQQAGVVRPDCQPLCSSRGSLVLARLTSAALLSLPPLN
jgi:hypothetical protein